MVPILAGDADYVVGSRFLGGPRRMQTHRTSGNRILTTLVRGSPPAVATVALTDGQSGYPGAVGPRPRRSAEIVHDYNYAQVLTLDLLGKGFRYLEVPIAYAHRRNGRSFVRLPTYLRQVVPAVWSARRAWATTQSSTTNERNRSRSIRHAARSNAPSASTQPAAAKPMSMHVVGVVGGEQALAAEHGDPDARAWRALGPLERGSSASAVITGYTDGSRTVSTATTAGSGRPASHEVVGHPPAEVVVGGAPDGVARPSTGSRRRARCGRPGRRRCVGSSSARRPGWRARGARGGSGRRTACTADRSSGEVDEHHRPRRHVDRVGGRPGRATSPVRRGRQGREHV